MQVASCNKFQRELSAKLMGIIAQPHEVCREKNVGKSIKNISCQKIYEIQVLVVFLIALRLPKI